jgi:phosphoglycolate phosphatase-like HAD superfamily hydrolase
MLRPYAEADEIPGLVDRFRAMYPEIAVAPTLALPGTHDAIAAVRASGGTVVVVTGKFTPNALLHTEALSLDVDHVVGEVWGVGKAEVLREHGCGVYVGDHVHDVEGALAAGAVSVSVLTGGCSEDELRRAGTHHVLRDLTEFAAWWSDHATGSTGFAPGP